MSAMTRSMNSSGGLQKIVRCVVRHRNEKLYAIYLLVIFECHSCSKKCPERSASGIWGNCRLLFASGGWGIGAVILLWQLISVIIQILVVKFSLLEYFALSIGRHLCAIQWHAVLHLHPRLLFLPCWQAFEENVTAPVLNTTQRWCPVRADIRKPSPSLRTRWK
jgi:ribosomal protein L37AE/L43A